MNEPHARNKKGVILIDVLLAVAILSSAGVAFVTLLVSTLEFHGRLHEREIELRRAERVLTATTLLTRTELEQRIGMRELGDFAIWVDRPEPYLFRVGVAPSARPAAELLATLVYRGGGGEAQ